MKNIFTIIALIVPTGAFCQTDNKKESEWRLMGSSRKKSDTSHQFYIHELKDSISYSKNTERCTCSVFSISVNNQIKLMPCDSLIREIPEFHFWRWTKEIIKIKGVYLREEKPIWVEQGSQEHPKEAIYFYNNKRVYPLEFFRQPIQK